MAIKKRQIQIDDLKVHSELMEQQIERLTERSHGNVHLIFNSKKTILELSTYCRLMTNDAVDDEAAYLMLLNTKEGFQRRKSRGG